MTVCTEDRRRFLTSGSIIACMTASLATVSTTPKVVSLSNIGYLPAEQKVIHLFVWSHAIGSKAEIFDRHLRGWVLQSICHLQILCFTVRAKLPFTADEHKYIWSHHGTQFFLALSKLYHHKRQEKIRNAERYNINRSPTKRRRVPYWRVATKDAAQSADSAPSDDKTAPPYFLRVTRLYPILLCTFGSKS